MNSKGYVLSNDLDNQYGQWPDKPWLTIWIRPRGTIRAIVDYDPERHVLILAALSGVTQAIESAVVDDISLTTMLIAVIVGPIGGIFSLYIGGGFLRWTGSLLGGQATSEDVRAAIAWSSIPSIASIILWAPDFALLGLGNLTNSDLSVLFYTSWICTGLISIIIGIWAFILLIKTLGEVHGFSAWRGLGSILLPVLVLGIPFCLFLMVILFTA